VRKGGPGDEETSGACHNETSSTGASKGQTRAGRNHGLRDSVCTKFYVGIERTYIDETGRQFGRGLKEHKTEAEAATSKPFATRPSASIQFVGTE